MPAKKEGLHLEYISADYREEPVLNHFSMNVFSGEICGVYAGTGAEMHCLIKVLEGSIIPKQGRVTIKGLPLHSDEGVIPTSISIIRKTSCLIDSLSVAENLNGPVFQNFYIHSPLLMKQALELSHQFDLALEPQVCAAHLSIVQRVTVELARALQNGSSVVVLENPSAFLSDHDTQQLVPVLNQLRNQGMVILVIDSVMDVLRTLCPRTILMHQGQDRWEFRGEKLNDAVLQHLIPSQSPSQIQPTQQQCNQDWKNPTPELHFIKTEFTSDTLVKAFSFVPDLRSWNQNGIPWDKKIVSVYQEQLQIWVNPDGKEIESFRQIISGSVAPKGSFSFPKETTQHINEQVFQNNRISIIAEDPGHSQIFDTLPAVDNFAFGIGMRVPNFWHRRTLRRHFIQKFAHLFPKRDATSLWRSAGHFDTEERLTMVYLRALIFAPHAVIVFKPLASTNPQHHPTILKLLQMLLDQGTGILVISSSNWEAASISSLIQATTQKMPPFALKNRL